MERKHTGIIRRIDDLGRIAIPKNIRSELRLREGTPLEFVIEGNDLILQPYYSQEICKYKKLLSAASTIIDVDMCFCDSQHYEIESCVQHILNADNSFGIYDKESVLIAWIYCKKKTPVEIQTLQIKAIVKLIEGLMAEESM